MTSATRISCSEYSFPAVSGQHERIGIVRALGFELVDVDENGELYRYEEDWHLD